MSERDMVELQALLERRLGRSWLEIVAWMQQESGLDEIAHQLTTGDFTQLMQTFRAGAERFAADVHDAYTTSGQATATWLGGEMDSVVRFDGADPRAIAWATQNKLDTVREITNEQRGVLREFITEGLKVGRNPLETARDIRGSLGLTQYQADIVANYRRQLEAGDYSGALERELADGRYDRSLAAAIRDGRTLPADQVDRMVDAYRRGWVGFRAETLARTEGLRALHEGNEALFRQAIANGDLEASELECEWHHAYVGKFPREDHAVMNGQRRPFGEAFESGSGVKLRYPGDPDAPASEVIGCKCVKSTVLV